MEVDDLEIPEDAKTSLRELGFSTLYPVQEQSIKNGLLEGRNLLISAPTASGKTLVPIIATIKKTYNNEGKVVYLVPLKALANEKFEEFNSVLKIKKKNGSKIKVGISTSDFASTGEELRNFDVIVATYEKMDSLIRHKPSWLKNISLLTFDEIHLIGSADRGPVVEIILTWLKEISPNSQNIALSATISNARKIAEWLNANLIQSDWRPVPLKEGVFFSNSIILDDETIQVSNVFGDELQDLANHAIKDNRGQILFFVPTRKRAVALARKLSPVSSLALSKNEKAILEKVSSELLSIEDLTPVGSELANLVKKGVAFHHAGLTSFQRKKVEEAFKKHYIKILVATPTLAAGVNLPARYVCVTSLERYSQEFGYQQIPILEYKQMAGRAGRPQFDEVGYSLIYARKQEDIDYFVNNYIKAKPEPIRSNLTLSNYITSAVLSTIVIGLASDEVELEEVFEKTFLAKQATTQLIKYKVMQSLDYLMKNGAVILSNGIKATPLGRRIAELYVLPETAFSILNKLSSLPRKVSEVTLLQIVVSTPDMHPLLSSTRKDLPWIDEFINEHYDELYFLETESAIQDQLKTIRAIEMWINEYSLDKIYEELDLEPGDLYALNEKATWLLFAASEIAKWSKYPELIKDFEILSTRVKYGIKTELLDLVSLEGIGRVRARNLYKIGIKSKEDIAKTSFNELVKVPGIGAKLAYKIKSQVGGQVKDIDEKEVTQKSLFGDERKY
ncbi:MAG: DEAD/DEAH box helicase [Thermoproteota archaeon]|nr:DEAD/DEAH box helicase [Candidatus Brockarchaeota archaeon]MBO3763096.1 DEAD/DEAH box helicase [Candidatus Brockarchaeota archaeon]MBO3767745.1 DEAD/DEAH box helicase [Candidatus Brockarchaeota archaeon]MBO3800725.1 DEAD/DEAH box helicase [Candidatus Brockarchaeota archaeon]